MTINDIELWTLQRYDYYVAGRTLLFNNQMQTGALLLGYTIENVFKHLLNSLDKIDKKLVYSHEFHKLLNTCLENKLLLDIEVSKDFIDFIQYNFHRRYPSQLIDTIQKAQDVGHSIGITPTIIINYDDFIQQLDRACAEYFKTPRASMALHAAKNVRALDGKYFFHSNYAALSRLNEIISYLDKDLEYMREVENREVYELNIKEHEAYKKILCDKGNLLVADKKLTMVTPSNNYQVIGGVKDFKYPGRYIKTTEGNEISTFSS